MVEPREIDHTRPLNRTSSTDSHPMIERLEKKKKKERKKPWMIVTKVNSVLVTKVQREECGGQGEGLQSM